MTRGEEPPTKLEFWEFLQEHGPATADELREQFGENVMWTMRALHSEGYVRTRLDYRYEARDLDSLRGDVSPFGAYGGDWSGPKPKDVKPKEVHR